MQDLAVRQRHWGTCLRSTDFGPTPRRAIVDYVELRFWDYPSADGHSHGYEPPSRSCLLWSLLARRPHPESGARLLLFPHRDFPLHLT
jgi:hypothetical protein